ncbi:DUF1566 domain-containing protein [Sulfurovum sp. NBC37-1]|uniref:Lcl domain-containing protein n=1 Tax=Sulfurovum sp. (strain NBC37-1) TaxID=387093 RepID=UPI00015879B9|nr:DUF1566 domain-containing protein [Sulfurovum sp. NBC37-1]BAF72971.1 hypothetical protein SUN_2029 [Sulfurovum sp. NBC37-1]
MNKFLIVMALFLQFLSAEDTVVIGNTMYQNQPFTKKDKHIFDTDWEGLRVWRWNKAQDYCKKLNINGYSNWRVASQKELQAIMTKKPTAKGLFVKSEFASSMPEVGGKYDDVWMWTREDRGKLGAFVNFKKAKSGWADKKYKGYVLCTRKVTALSPKQKRTVCKDNARQEMTYSADWVKAWHTCSGYTALKKDGTLWQFGKVGECGWGGITPFDPQTGKAIYKEKHIYTLKPKKIGSGFRGAKIINGGYRLYAIKKDGTLWGWGEGLGVKPIKLDASHNWSDFAVKYEGNGCCAYDVGLKKDGTLWRFPDSAFALGKYKTALKLKKISQFSDWKKIILDCCRIYGMRKDGSLWRADTWNGPKIIFKRYSKAKKESYVELDKYPVLKSKMNKMSLGTIYSSNYFNKNLKANKDGTLCLLPIIKEN